MGAPGSGFRLLTTVSSLWSEKGQEGSENSVAGSGQPRLLA